MRGHATRPLLVCLGVLFVVAAGAGPAAAGTRLPAHLRAVRCSRLADLHGVAKWRHYARDLFGSEWSRADYIINRETGGTWNPAAHNASGATGLAQFMPEWWNGHGSTGWCWNPRDPILSIRMFFFVAHHPQLGGWGNWGT